MALGAALATPGQATCKSSSRHSIPPAQLHFRLSFIVIRFMFSLFTWLDTRGLAGRKLLIFGIWRKKIQQFRLKTGKTLRITKNPREVFSVRRIFR
jgi:hypothetical protein